MSKHASLLVLLSLSAPMLPAAATAGTLTTLYDFTGNADGSQPSGVISTGNGTLYGQTQYGGDECFGPGKGDKITAGCGTAFRFNPDGTLQTLVTFNGKLNGEAGVGEVARNASTIYGEAELFGSGSGAAANGGLVYSVTNLGRKFTVLHRFNTKGDGEGSITAPVIDPQGNLFGVTSEGTGASANGILFEVKPDGTYSILHQFSGGTDGSTPTSIVIDPAGVVYGSTLVSLTSTGATCSYEAGGPKACGIVYSFTPSTGVFAILHSFSGFYDGATPYLGGVNTNGALFGVTYSNRGGYGSIFEMPKNASGYSYKRLWSFTGKADGGYPGVPYVSSNGQIIGTTREYNIGKSNFGPGTLYSLIDGTFTTLYSFAGGANGSEPAGRPFPDSTGAFYGVTLFGGHAPGDNCCGTIWKYTP